MDKRLNAKSGIFNKGRLNAMIDLHEVMKHFITLGNVTVGMGPKHPSRVAREMQEEIDQFFARYPALHRDQSYVDFLEYYSAAFVGWPHRTLMISIYGFSEDVTIPIAQPDEPLVDEDGFHRFAEIIVKTGEGRSDFVGMEFAFDATGERKSAVYHRTAPMGVDSRTLPYEWYCDTFLEWLIQVVEKQGRLF
jgi:hypothetical protein